MLYKDKPKKIGANCIYLQVWYVLKVGSSLSVLQNWCF